MGLHSERYKLRRMILASILSALIIVMSFVPYTGYISYGVIEITTLHIVVVLGAVLLGWKYGALLGLVWGVTCLIRAYLYPVFLPFGFGNPLVSVLPRVIVGAVGGLVFSLLSKTRLRKGLALSISAAAATLANTVLVLTAMSIFCKTSAYEALKSILSTIIGLNGSIELIAALLLIPPVYFALQPHETVLGVDFGASTTKLAVVKNGRLLRAVRKYDDESLDEALNRLGVGDVHRAVVTGVGASFIEGNLNGLPTTRADEFTALFRGASRCAKKHNCLVVSVGTGTSFVRVTPFRAWHVGGSGIGGAMLMGLSKKVCQTGNLTQLMELARQGNFARIDLELRDVCAGTISNLTPTTTVANLAKLDTASREDAALGILNLTFQSIGVMAAFAVQKHWTRTIVFAGTITDLPIAEEILDPVAQLHHVRFIIPDNAQFITAIGATLV